MSAMAKRVPVDAPWEARRAAVWDALSVGAWLSSSRVPTKLARDLIDATVRACFACDVSEVSLLNWLFLARSAGGVEALMTVAGGYQDAQVEGGVGRIPDAMAAELGEAVVLGAAVTAVSQDGDRVTVTSDGGSVTARRVVLSLPRALAAGIRFEPALPGDHVLLLHQIPAGTEVKTVAIYDEPFWRSDGISGATVALDDQIEVTLDTTQPGHDLGVMATYAAGPQARALWRRGEDGRRDALLTMLVTRFGPKAAGPPRGRGGQLGRGTLDPRLFVGAFPHRRPDPVRALPAASRWAVSTGPEPRRPRCHTARSTAPCVRASGSARRSCALRPE